MKQNFIEIDAKIRVQLENETCEGMKYLRKCVICDQKFETTAKYGLFCIECKEQNHRFKFID